MAEHASSVASDEALMAAPRSAGNSRAALIFDAVDVQRHGWLDREELLAAMRQMNNDQCELDEDDLCQASGRRPGCCSCTT